MKKLDSSRPFTEVKGAFGNNELDLKRVDFVKCMRGAGLPIEVLIEYMKLVKQGDQTIEARKEILEEQRERKLDV